MLDNTPPSYRCSVGRRFCIIACIGAFLLMSLSSYANAGAISFIPALEVKETYTDNVFLSPKGSEMEEFITTIYPSARLQGTGSRLEANALYGFERIMYANNSDKNTTYHKFKGGMTAELMKNNFFLDARGSYTQQITEVDRPTPADNITITDNRTDVATWLIRPYLRHDFGKQVLVELSWAKEGVDYSDNRITGSKSTVLHGSLQSGQLFNRTSWVLEYNNEKIDYIHSLNEADLINTELRLRYKVFLRHTMLATAGYDNNNYEPAGDRLEGSYWSAGWSWTPSTRIIIEGQAGERYYGKTYGVLFKRTTKRSTFDLSYNEGLATYKDIQYDSVKVGFTNLETGEILVDESGEPVTQEIYWLTITDEIFLRKTSRLKWKYRFVKSTLALSLRYDELEYQGTREDEEVKGGETSLLVPMGRQTDIDMLLGVQNHTYLETDNSKVNIYGRLGLKVSYGRQLDASAYYMRSVTYIESPHNNYLENRIILSARLHFD